MKNLKSGDFVIEGTVVGKTLSEFPVIDISFGLQDVESDKSNYTKRN